MRIVGILGGPRKGGNSEVLLDVALEEAQKNGVVIDKISLRDKSIAPCDGCLGSIKTGKCVIEDDGVRRDHLGNSSLLLVHDQPHKDVDGPNVCTRISQTATGQQGRRFDRRSRRPRLYEYGQYFQHVFQL